VSITVTGLTELYASVERVAAVAVLEPPMRRGVLRLEAYMKVYPSAPPMSRYRRTGTLGRRWTTRIERTTNGLTGRVGNNVEYGPWVQSERFQVRWHRRTGWHTDADAVRVNEAAIVADFEQAINVAIRG
jgi:hypothetical protein